MLPGAEWQAPASCGVSHNSIGVGASTSSIPLWSLSNSTIVAPKTLISFVRSLFIRVVPFRRGFPQEGLEYVEPFQGGPLLREMPMCNASAGKHTGCPESMICPTWRFMGSYK